MPQDSLNRALVKQMRHRGGGGGSHHKLQLVAPSCSSSSGSNNNLGSSVGNRSSGSGDYIAGRKRRWQQPQQTTTTATIDGGTGASARLATAATAFTTSSSAGSPNGVSTSVNPYTQSRSGTPTHPIAVAPPRAAKAVIANMSLRILISARTAAAAVVDNANDTDEPPHPSGRLGTPFSYESYRSGSHFLSVAQDPASSCDDSMIFELRRARGSSRSPPQPPGASSLTPPDRSDLSGLRFSGLDLVLAATTTTAGGSHHHHRRRHPCCCSGWSGTDCTEDGSGGLSPPLDCLLSSVSSLPAPRARAPVPVSTASTSTITATNARTVL